MKKVLYILTTTLFLIAPGRETNSTMEQRRQPPPSVEKTEQEWKAQLSLKNTLLSARKEPVPTPGAYNMHFDGTSPVPWMRRPLFTSDSKFDSHCGWPSFDQGIAKGAILEKLDKTHGMIRTEIVCASCGLVTWAMSSTTTLRRRPALLCQ